MFRYRNKYRPYGVLNKQQGGTSASSSLLTDLVSYWKLDNLTWADSVGSNNLTNNGSVTVGTPKVGAGSAEFDGTNSLSLAALDVTNTEYSFSLWFKKPIGAVGTLLSFGVNGRDVWAYLTSGTNLRIYFPSFVFDDITLTDDNTWNHLYISVTPSIGTAILNNTTTITVVPDDTIDTIEPIKIGSRNISLFYTGLIDEIGVWARLLTSGEITLLYNSGAGLTYPF